MLIKRKVKSLMKTGRYILTALLLVVSVNHCLKAEAEELPPLFGVETPKEVNSSVPSYVKEAGEAEQGLSAKEVATQATIASVTRDTRAVQATVFEFSGGAKSSYTYQKESASDFYIRYAFNGSAEGGKAIIRLYYALDFNISPSQVQIYHYFTNSFRYTFTGETGNCTTGTVVIDGRRYATVDHVISIGQSLAIADQSLTYSLQPAEITSESTKKYSNIAFPNNYKFKVMADVLDYNTKNPLSPRIQKDFTWVYPQSTPQKAVALPVSANSGTGFDVKYDATSSATKVTVGAATSPNSGQTSADKAQYIEYRFKLGTDYVANAVTPMTDLVIEDTLPAGAEFVAEMNPGWTKTGNIVKKIIPISERPTNNITEQYSFPLILRYPNAKEGDIYTNKASIKATIPKNAVVAPGVTYNPYTTPSSNPNAFEATWAVSKPITAHIENDYPVESLFAKAQDYRYDLAETDTNKLKYYDTEVVRKDSYLLYGLSLKIGAPMTLKAGTMVMVDEPKDDRFEVADIVYVDNSRPLKTANGSSIEAAFDAIVEVEVEVKDSDGKTKTKTKTETVTIANLAFNGDPLASYRGKVKKVTIKNNKDLIASTATLLQFQVRLRAKDYTKPLLTSSTAVARILNEGTYYAPNGTNGTIGVYAPIRELEKGQGMGLPSNSIDYIEYSEGGNGTALHLPSPTLTVTKGDILKNVTVAYLLPSRKDYNIGSGEKKSASDNYDLYEAARKDIETRMNSGRLIDPAVASFTGGKVELVELKRDEQGNVINKDGYKGTGTVGLVISFSTLEMKSDLVGTENTTLATLYRYPIYVGIRAKEFSPESFVIDCYFKGTPANFDSSKYTVNQQVTDSLDINNNGNKTELVSKSLVRFSYKKPLILRGLKETKGALDIDYVDSYTLSQTTLKGISKYQLTVLNELTTTANGVMIVDVLPRVGDTLYTQVSAKGDLNPRNSEYNMYLASAVTFDTTIAGSIDTSGVAIYYSTQAVPKNQAAFTTFVNYADNWTTTLPSDKTKVTAIKTSTMSIQQGKSVRLNFDTRVDGNVLGKKIAINSFMVGTAEGNKVESNIVKTQVQGPVNREIPITKNWADNNNAAGLRPATITINLLQNGKVFKSAEITGGSAAASWDYTFKDLPVDSEKGKEWKYTIEEVDTKDYASSSIVSSVNDKGVLSYTLTNKLKENTVRDIPVIKKWVDGLNEGKKRPTNVKLQLKQNGIDYKSPVTITGESTAETWTYTFTNLPKYDSQGTAYVYTVVEINPDARYEVIYGEEIYDENGVEGIQLSVTNTLVTDIPITKKWVDDNNIRHARPASIKIQLKQNGVAYQDPVKLEGIMTAETWTYTFAKLPVYDSKGNKYTYTVDEEKVPNYDKVLGADGKTITNTLINQRDIAVKKIWKLSPAENEPESIEVQLKQNGKNYGEVVTISYSTSWKYTYKNIPIYDENGDMYEYTIVEVNSGGSYQSSVETIYQDDDKNKPVIGLTITNSSPIRLYVLQKVIDPIDSLPLPAKGFYRLAESGVSGSMGLTSKSLATAKDTEVVAPKTDYAVYILSPESSGTYIIEDIVPEYYTFIGAVSAPIYDLSAWGDDETAFHVYSTVEDPDVEMFGQKSQPFVMDWTNDVGMSEYWVTFYITPKIGSGDDGPRPHSWYYKTNTFGK